MDSPASHRAKLKNWLGPQRSKSSLWLVFSPLQPQPGGPRQNFQARQRGQRVTLSDQTFPSSMVGLVLSLMPAGADSHRHGTWPARRSGLSSASRAKRHTGARGSAQTLGRTMDVTPESRTALHRARLFLRLAEGCSPERRIEFEAFVEATIVFARAALHRLQTSHQRHARWHS